MKTNIVKEKFGINKKEETLGKIMDRKEKEIKSFLLKKTKSLNEDGRGFLSSTDRVSYSNESESFFCFFE